MSYLIAAPGMLAAAAADVASIGSSLSAAHVAAAAPTTAVVAAAGDEVSAAIASLFSGHGQASTCEFQRITVGRRQTPSLSGQPVVQPAHIAAEPGRMMAGKVRHDQFERLGACILGTR